MGWILTDADFNILLAAEIPAEYISLSTVGTPTYTTLEDYINTAGDSGLLSGGAVTDDGDGTVTIAASTGLIYTTDSTVGSLVFFDLAEDTTVPMTDESLNYVYVQYNGGTPRYQATTSETDISGTDEFVVALVWRSGTDIHTVNVGKHIDQLPQQLYRHEYYVEGLVRANGCVLSDAGSLQVNLSAGNLAWALHLLSISAATPKSFKLFYNDGSWQEGSLVSTFPNTQYNNYGVGLSDLTANRYGIYWMYLVSDGDMYGVYGIGDYTLAQAEIAQPPANIPPELAAIGVLIAKVIFQKSGAEIIEIIYPWTTTFLGSAASDHGSLAGLTDDDHTQYVLVTGLEADRATVDSYWEDLTDGGETALHSHAVDHGGLDGLSDDDHAQYVLVTDLEADRATVNSYWEDLTDGGETALHSHAGGGTGDLKADGTVPMTADWPFGNYALYIGDDTNANLTIGLTINQGANDDEILAFKSSDIAHGATTYAETDTYALFSKIYADEGGLRIRALAEDNASNYQVLQLTAYGSQADTTKGASAQGLINLYLSEHDNSNTLTDVTANGNLLVITARKSSDWSAVYIVDEDGDTWQSGGGTFGAKCVGANSETIPECAIDTSAPGTTYPGLLWLDTN